MKLPMWRVAEFTGARGEFDQDLAEDAEGLAGWVHALNAGTSLQTVANDFVGSAEFQNTYGNLTDTAFVTQLYENVLHRLPDPGGMSGCRSIG